MDNLELRLASLKHLLFKTNLYQKLIHNKNYKNLNTKKYKESLKSLCNSIEGEIHEALELLKTEGVNQQENFLYVEVTNYLKNEAELKPLKAKLNEISENILRESESCEVNILAGLDMPPEWLFPTSTANSKSDMPIINSYVQKNFANNEDELFINVLMSDERVKQTLNLWKNKSKIAERYPILEEAIKAHIEGKFYLSVSTLIPQVEGLLRDSLQSMGKNADFDSMGKEDMKKAISTLKDSWKYQFPKLSEATLVLDSLPDVVSDLYEKYSPSESVQGKLYRHGICHGTQTDFGSKKNSTKLILILDRVIFFYVMT